MTTKEQFNQLIREKGYKTLYAFCKQNNLDYGNMSRRLDGIRQKIEISFMFKLANMLHVPVETIIEIFYTDEWITNRAMIDENDLTIERE